MVGATRPVLHQARAALVASGTATLEACLMRCPTVIAYKASPLTALITRIVIRVPFLGIVNLLAGKEVCPELLQSRARAPALAAALNPLLLDGPRRENMLAEMDKVNASLGAGGAAARAAAIVVQELG